jgi:hypothetical protein
MGASYIFSNERVSNATCNKRVLLPILKLLGILVTSKMLVEGSFCAPKHSCLPLCYVLSLGTVARYARPQTQKGSSTDHKRVQNEDESSNLSRATNAQARIYTEFPLFLCSSTPSDIGRPQWNTTTPRTSCTSRSS